MTADKFIPQDLVPVCILYHNDTERTSPIGGINFCYDIFILRQDAFVTHGSQNTPYSFNAYAIFDGELGQGLFPIYIISLNLMRINPFATDKLSVTIFAPI